MTDSVIVIGKYCVSKQVLMSEPAQLYVTNMETNERKIYFDIKALHMLWDEGLDADLLHKYLDEIRGYPSTKDDRMKIMREYIKNKKNENNINVNSVFILYY